jgi:hypothetical protein
VFFECRETEVNANHRKYQSGREKNYIAGHELPMILICGGREW